MRVYGKGLRFHGHIRFFQILEGISRRMTESEDDVVSSKFPFDVSTLNLSPSLEKAFEARAEMKFRSHFFQLFLSITRIFSQGVGADVGLFL